MIRRILVGLAGTPYSTTAARCAVELAKAHNAQLSAVTVLAEHKLGEVGDALFHPSDGSVDDPEERARIARERVGKAISDFQQGNGRRT